MPLAGQTALAKSTLSQKPAARCLPRPPCSSGCLPPLQIRDSGVAAQAAQRPPCRPIWPVAPIPDRHRAGVPPPRASLQELVPAPPSHLFLGRVPSLFGYANLFLLSSSLLNRSTSFSQGLQSFSTLNQGLQRGDLFSPF